MKTARPTPATRFRGIFFVGLLAFILAVLFWRSFLPGYVHFSNDGPLGALHSAWLNLSAAHSGMWDDLNSLGINEGTWSPDINMLVLWLLGPEGHAKFLPALALFILGASAWVFFRQLKFSPLACALGALAAALNSTFFALACWGLGTQPIAIGMDFFALALVAANSAATPALIRWARLALAGLAVGMNVIDGADIGAIFSIFIAAYVFFKALVDEGGMAPAKCARGFGGVAVVAIFAGFMATQTVVSLVSVQIQGIAGTGQENETKAAHWDFATQWSVPKKETLGLFVPGLFGYKMDTPNHMMPAFKEAYEGGIYWGGVGRDPGIDRFFDSGQAGTPPQGIMRFSGGGNYCGVLVVLVAFWALAQSLRRRDSLFPDTQKKFIWFWTVVLVISLLFAYGRFAPFYALLYKLPYFSTIRNPVKFLIVFSWAMVILFAYGVNGLARRHLVSAASNSPSSQLRNWWAKLRGFDQKWTYACAAAVGASLLGWFIYASEKPSLVRYLQTVGFGDASTAGEIAAFSIGQVGWFVLLLALTAALVTLVIAGVFSGKRAKLGGFLLGLLLVLDLSRANLPYIIHWDYKQKYEVGSLNPIVDFLRDKSYEHRVAYGLPHPLATPPEFGLFGQLHGIEWAQHHFPYYNIQSLDVIQMARVPVDLAAFQDTLRIGIKQDGSGQWMIAPETFPRVARLWELTNTRYLLGPAGLLDLYNGQFDPAQHRFRIIRRFDIAPKPGILQPTQLEELTAVRGDNGAYALFEFTGALPRVKLYSNWQTNTLAALKGFTTNGLGEEDLKMLASLGTNDFITLKTLASPAFDPQKTVLLAKPPPETAAGTTNENSGTVEFKSYAPTDIKLQTQAAAPTVLLLNDKYDANWRVTVDGKPAEMLRCNFIMRGVYLGPGTHTVEFQFSLPNKPLYVTLAAIGVGILLCGFLFCSSRRNPQT